MGDSRSPSFPTRETTSTTRIRRPPAFRSMRAGCFSINCRMSPRTCSPRAETSAFVTAIRRLSACRTHRMDPAHAAEGFTRAANAFWDPITAPTPSTRQLEIPLALRGYRLLADRMPFSVVPGNHDYDAMWTHVAQPIATNLTPRTAGPLHVGGLGQLHRRRFRRNRRSSRIAPWYVGAHDDGADSAQIFEAGGYRFLHIGLQFDALKASLAWASSVIAASWLCRRSSRRTTIWTIGAGERRIRWRTITRPTRTRTRRKLVWDTLSQPSRSDLSRVVRASYARLQHRSQSRRTCGPSTDVELSEPPANCHRGGTRERRWHRRRLDASADVRHERRRPIDPRARTFSTHYRKFSTEMPEYAACVHARKTFDDGRTIPGAGRLHDRADGLSREIRSTPAR